MRNRLPGFARALVVGALMGVMIARPAPCARAALAALTAWATAVVPSLFPMLACALMLAGGGGKPAACAALALLTGSPGGARLLASVQPTGRTLARLAAVTGVMSPGFLLGTVAQWLGDSRAGMPMLLAHWLAALVVGACAGGRQQVAKTAAARALIPRVSPGEALAQAAAAMLPIAGYMALASIAGVLLSAALSGAALAVALCACEVASGVSALARLPLPLAARAALACAACSFGGLSILAQNAAYLAPLGVKTRRLLCYRLSQAALSAPVCWALCLLYKL